MMWRSVLVLVLGLRLLAAPALADTASPSPAPSAQPGTLGYATWSAASSEQKELIVRGETDGVITGYFEPLLALEITSMLTGNKDITTVKDRLSKTLPAFSKKPSEYVPLIDAVYEKPAAQQLSVGNVVACLADHPAGAPAQSTDDCIKSFL